ncbi:MAG: ABC transporter permease [Bdellovibrionales bacterium]
MSVVAVITLTVGEVFYYFQEGQLLLPAHPLWLLYFVVMAGLVFGLLGLVSAFWAKSFDQLSAISTFVILPLTYLGGVFVPISSLGEFWQGVAKLNPLLYFINGLRYSMLSQAEVSVEFSALFLLTFGVVFYFVSQFVLSRVTFTRW